MNNHAGSDVILIFLTLDRAKGGGGPTRQRRLEARQWVVAARRLPPDRV